MADDSRIYEQLLVLRAQDGEQTAMDLLVQRWDAKLTRYATHLTGDTEGAAEVMQEVWLSVVRSLRRLQDPAHFRPWIYRIVSNKCTDWIRHRVRNRGTAQPITMESVAMEEEAEEASDEIALLRTAIARLPTDKRMILTLFYQDDLSIRDIAKILDIPEGTVKSRLFHARSQLKQLLEGKDQ